MYQLMYHVHCIHLCQIWCFVICCRVAHSIPDSAVEGSCVVHGESMQQPHQAAPKVCGLSQFGIVLSCTCMSYTQSISHYCFDAACFDVGASVSGQLQAS